MWSFPLGVPDAYVEPLTFTYYSYVGPVGGTGGGGGGAPVTIVPQDIATSAGTPQAISPLSTLVQVTIDNAVDPHRAHPPPTAARWATSSPSWWWTTPGGGVIRVTPTSLTGPYNLAGDEAPPASRRG